MGIYVFKRSLSHGSKRPYAACNELCNKRRKLLRFAHVLNTNFSNLFLLINSFVNTFLETNTCTPPCTATWKREKARNTRAGRTE